MAKLESVELQCPRCGATMKWHENENLRKCDYCGYTAKSVDADLASTAKVIEQWKAAERQQQIEKEEEEERKRKKSTKAALIFLGVVFGIIAFNFLVIVSVFFH